MSCIGTFSTLKDEDIQRSNDMTENILEHGLDYRQKKIRRVLEEMQPCLERWKPSRPASALDAPADSTLDSSAASQGSNKIARLA